MKIMSYCPLKLKMFFQLHLFNSAIDLRQPLQEDPKRAMDPKMQIEK